MPKKRKTKLTKRAKPKLPDSDDQGDLSEHERSQKLELFLQDFDIEVNDRIAAMRKEAEKMCSLINSSYKMELFKLPKAMRNLKRTQFIAKGGSVNAVVLDEVTEGIDRLASTLAPILSCSKSTARVPLGNVGNTKINECTNLDPVTIKEEVLSSEEVQPTETKKTRGKGTRTTKARAALREQNNCSDAPLTVRRSTRKGALKNQLVTPAMNTGRHNALTMGWDTPAVTPKFDPRLPVTPAVMREPKAGERIMSMCGSPLTNPSHAGAKVPEAYIPLRNGQAIQLKANQNIQDLALTEVDDHTRKNLLVLQEQISKILKVKPLKATTQS
ncbi:borealin-like [Saccoglossus kowalevskii]|uniref:Borealin-like n=1 Tax=Saccoglossus kowalevskii TaxID=10224 RepID=A0ABM0GQI5_SACKO|nr:PREDICTED: borealin-like [Saccoglossus kowalevskii]